MSDETSIEQSKALNDQMRCGLLASPNGDIMIMHDKKLPSHLEWIEFNKEDNKLYLIDENGMATDLGLTIDEAMRKNLSHGVEVLLTELNDSKIVSQQKVSIVVQNY